MIVLKYNFKIYKPKLTIETCIVLEQLYGSVTRLIEKKIPSLYEQVFLLSLCLNQYQLQEDEIYELIDGIDDLFSLILALYEEAGLINTEQQNPVDVEKTGNEEINNEPRTFEDMCNDMLIQCLSIGLSRQEFFNSTLKEVTQYVEAYKKQQQNKLEEQAYFDWMLANLIGNSVARLMSKDAKFPKLEEAYPFINETEDKPKLDENELTSEEKLASAHIMEWAMAMHRKQEKKRKQNEDKVE
jgi:hypothetical protein